MAGSTSLGAQQFTPTATISGTPAATANASASGWPGAGRAGRRSCSSTTQAHRAVAPGRPTPRPRRYRAPFRWPARRLPRRPGSPAAADATRQLRNRKPVPPDVLLAVGQRRAVRARPTPPPTRPSPSGLIAGRRGQFDAAPHQPLRVVSRDSARRETVEGRLVARRRRDRRAGREKSPVSSDDLLRRVEQQPRRPQVVGQVVAARLQFGGQATIADQNGIVGDCERHFATLRSARRRASQSGNGGDTPGTRWRVPWGLWDA